VKLGRRKFLQRRDGVVDAVRFLAVHLLGGGAITFAAFLCHNFLQCERAFGSPAVKGERTIRRTRDLSKVFSGVISKVFKLAKPLLILVKPGGYENPRSL